MNKTKLKVYIVTFHDGTVKIMDDEMLGNISLNGQGFSVIDFDLTVPSNF